MIQPAPTAPDGLVSVLPRYSPDLFVPGSACLCRNTAPLVAHCYGLLRRDVPCRILGRDIGAQLASLVKQMHATTLEDLSARLANWLSREVLKAIKDDRSPERVMDQADCLTFFIDSLDESSRTIGSLLAKIELMFSDAPNTGNVTLSTIHKSKGLEYPIVFLLDRELMPSRFAKLPWQRKQELNLLYVATTRAQHTLHYISSGCWID